MMGALEQIYKMLFNNNTTNQSILQQVQQYNLLSQYSIANFVMTEKEPKVYQFLTSNDTKSTANTTHSSLTPHQQQF